MLQKSSALWCFCAEIGEFSGNVHIYSKREVMKINCFPLVVFFRKKFSRAEDCAEDFLVCVVRRNFRHTTSAYSSSC